MALQKAKLYKQIATSIGARLNCLAEEERSGKIHPWTKRHGDTVADLVREFMPSGSGIDSGTKIDFEKSNAEKLVFYASYHHMNDGGMYDGWTDHTITVKASLQFGFSLTISGSNRNQIKEVLHEEFHVALSTVVEWNPITEEFNRATK